MTIILDTNVYISAFVFGGKCDIILQFCALRRFIVTSDFIIQEVENKLLTKFKSPVANVNIVLSNLQSTVKIVESTGEKPKVCRDPDDDNILWLAQSANANFIVTGDKDLLVLESFGTCQIVSVADFINQIMPTI
jgi:uncharacterized protein